jgi:hypothetical protein
VVVAAALLLLGFLLHPFRKARRRRSHSSESSTTPETAQAEAVQEVLSPDSEEDSGELEPFEELVSQTEQAR